MTQRIVALAPVSNGADADIEFTEPYRAVATLKGSSALLFHAWNVEAVAEKGGAAKGSKSKKRDNVESYVWRNTKGELCLPGEYVRQAIINAARFRQDPRSPRKSAMDLFKAAVVVASELCSLGQRDWDYLDQRRVQVMRAGITRVRPALAAGWTCEAELDVLLPEYVPPELLLDVLGAAGRLIGVGDFRPTYGRFQVTSWVVQP